MIFTFKLSSQQTYFLMIISTIAFSCNSSYNSNDAQLDSTATNSDTRYAIVNFKLKELNRQIINNNLDYAVGLTSVAGMAIQEITGEKELSQQENDSVQRVLQQEDQLERDGVSNYIKVKGITLNPNAPHLDLRDYGLVTPVKDQNPAGSCWSFGAMSAFESNFAVTNSKNIDASEQYVINCSGAGTADKGGLAFNVFRWMVKNNKNVDDENNTPYRASDFPCLSTPPATNYYAVEWKFVDPNQNPSAIPSVAQIKDAICKYGVISASVYVTDAFQYYKFNPGKPTNTYVFKENETNSGTNHAISLIGWDDARQAWILKNSWGTGWGITCNRKDETGYTNAGSGYMWIDYKTNNIGRRAAWVRARGTR